MSKTTPDYEVLARDIQAAVQALNAALHAAAEAHMKVDIEHRSMIRVGTGSYEHFHARAWRPV